MYLKMRTFLSDFFTFTFCFFNLTAQANDTTHSVLVELKMKQIETIERQMVNVNSKENRNLSWFIHNASLQSNQSAKENDPNESPKSSTTFAATLQITGYLQFIDDSRTFVDRTDALLKEHHLVLQSGEDLMVFSFQLQEKAEEVYQYAYQTLGIDTDWHYTKENSIRISGLPYGHFSIRVKAQNKEGAWTEQEIVVPVHVIEPMTSKFWFKTMIGLVIIGLFIYYFAWRTKYLQKAKKHLAQIVTAETDVIKNSLQQKESLLKEIHHRVKNSLTVISSLLDFQLTSDATEQTKNAFQESQNRVNTMALIHQRLYQNGNLAALEMKGFIEDLFMLTARVFGHKKHNVETEFLIPPISLDIDTAIPLGLILNELLTNSFKYAFNKEKNGQLKIELQEHTKGSFTLLYADNGPGLPIHFKLQEEKSIGFKLIHLLAKQMCGTATYHTVKGMPTFTIQLKDSQTRNQI
jgi:two-component sensor histidine kinase